ncbi:756_t:CDS:2 [Funneliformis geosporum]|uniref:11801_t:CDS:1 n=1 Tax=Funneliformis geosporum TaxID=1117311 RepID=A0A9W4SJ81_9GLOM|nr:756_t:CDS:2 [Funneliformis geosporum]CAI2168983.1 11801_t:CDS:2 [Funneliformis geosporum]
MADNFEKLKNDKVLQVMASEVQAICSEKSFEEILVDLHKTRNVEVTINRIFDGKFLEGTRFDTLKRSTFSFPIHLLDEKDAASCKHKVHVSNQENLIIIDDIVHQRCSNKDNINQKLNEEINRVKEAEKLERKTQKEQQRLERKKQKEEREVEKQRLKQIQEVNKIKYDKFELCRELILDVSNNLSEKNLVDYFRDNPKYSLLTINIFQHDFPNIIKWRRKFTVEWDDELYAFMPIPEKIQEESFLLIYFEISEFTKLIKEDILSNNINKIQETFISKRLIILIEGYESYCRRRKTQVNRNFTNAVRSEELLWLQVIAKCLIVHTKNIQDTAEMIGILSADIATIPYKNRNCDLNFWAEGQVRSGTDSSNTWLRMLQEIQFVTEPVARGIINAYPTVKSLYNAYQRCLTREEAENLLTSVENRHHNYSQELENLIVVNQSSSELERIFNFIEQHQELMSSNFQTAHEKQSSQSVAFLKQLDALSDQLQVLVASLSVVDQTDEQGPNSQQPSNSQQPNFDVISGDPDPFFTAQSPAANPAQPINSNSDQFNSGIPPENDFGENQYIPTRHFLVQHAYSEHCSDA